MTAEEHSVLRLLRDAHRAYRRGWPAIIARRRDRLAAIIAYSREHSPLYRDLYRDLPARIDYPELLPVTSKALLMPRFNDWVTDSRATQDLVQAFVADPTLIGRRFLSAYTVATTSGTTGVRGTFLLDEHALAVAAALSWRMLSTWLSPAAFPRLVAGRGRVAMVTATGGHFASSAAAARLRGSAQGRSRVHALSVHTPLPELVAQLNALQPAVLAPYASTAALLAAEQQAGRLRIRPALVALTAEGLPEAETTRIAAAFGAVVGNSYAATECPFLSYSCAEGWLHVNADWALLEPVDAKHRPIPPGQQSHTVLLTNLANRVQPILRYDLGDSVLVRPDPCPCGAPLPALRVQGRTADLLTLPTPTGSSVTITPLDLTTRLDRVPGLKLFQIRQTTPTELSVRLTAAADAVPDRVWSLVHRELTELIARNGLTHVTVRRATGPPEPGTGGKYRLVEPLTPTSRSG
ncbi:phenylacetate--CoA ligase family protein [Pseudonocardia sp. RS010]|uniref:phenylacetate--CoA ligase family protein n=1 Tax=Pseudonocardia sp. RS010 TaxID=3385979 RepID=UPI0039A2943A